MSIHFGYVGYVIRKGNTGEGTKSPIERIGPERQPESAQKAITIQVRERNRP